MKARVTWTSASQGGRQFLPTGSQYSTVSRFPEDGAEWSKEAWSIVIDFSPPPDVQGNPSIGVLRFLSSDAPTERLRPGREFNLYEGEHRVAVVTLL
jgi:hypothetical protein